MWYGFQDVLRDTVGLRSKSERLRPQEFWAVDDVSFELKRGECLGLIGPNGSGKTTLLRILNGIIRPDRGSVKMRGRVGALIEVGAGFHPQLTGRENVYVNAAILGMSKRETDAKFEKIVEFADIGDFLDSPVKFYSSGMLVRLGMAVALHTDPKILLVDEVFAVGDMSFQAKCLNRIGKFRRRGTSFILVSHSIHLIAGYSHRVLVLDRGKKYALGAPKPTIEQYLELMRSKPSGRDSEIDDLTKGSGRIQFKNVHFYDDAGNLVDGIDATQPVHLKIDYESIMDFANTELDLMMYNSKNEAFFQASNLFYDQPLHIPKGRGSIFVHFPYLPSNSGRLVVHIALWNRAREELFDWRRGIKLDVTGCPLSVGSTWLPCSFETIRDKNSYSD